MADQEVFHAVRVDQPRDLYIKGELVTAQAGNYMLTDAQGNIVVLDHSSFHDKYAAANDGSEGHVVEVKPSARRAAKNEAEQELKVVVPGTEDQDGAKAEPNLDTVTKKDEALVVAPKGGKNRAAKTEPEAEPKAEAPADTENAEKAEDQKGTN